MGFPDQACTEGPEAGAKVLAKARLVVEARAEEMAKTGLVAEVREKAGADARADAREKAGAEALATATAKTGLVAEAREKAGAEARAEADEAQMVLGVIWANPRVVRHGMYASVRHTTRPLLRKNRKLSRRLTRTACRLQY